MKMTSFHSFILFRPSFYFKGLVWRQNLVPLSQNVTTTCPWDPSLMLKRKICFHPREKKGASNFCDLFHFTLLLIFTRTVAIWPFFVVFCFSIHTVHTVNSPNLPPPTHGGGGCMGGGSIAQNGQKEPFCYRYL